MTSRNSILLALLFGGLTTSQIGCTPDDTTGSDCKGGKCDSIDPANAACGRSTIDGSGTGRDVASILGNNDQFARFVLVEGNNCPSTTDDVMAKLNEVTDCGSEANGTMVVNEKSSHDGVRDESASASAITSAKNANRTVISRQCAVQDPPEEGDEPAETKPCIGDDVSEFDFIMDQCADSNNTPNCFTDESGPSFFQNAECVSCLTKGDDRLHKGDLRTGEERCLDRDAESPGSEGEVPAFNLLFSAFSSINQVSQGGLEVIAFDETEGIFNFYKENQGGWAFMGNSKDFQQGQGGFCRGCHPSGGLTMKELDSPWNNWDINGDVPHSDDIIEANPDVFGSAFPLGGEGLELDIVRPGNGIMNRKRVERLSARVTAAKGDRSSERDSFDDPTDAVFTKDEMHELLKPLFCTEQINFATGTFGSEGLFKHDMLNDDNFIDIPGGEYDTVIDELGQVRGTGALTSKDGSAEMIRPTNGDAFDSFEGLYSVMRSEGLLSAEFIQDIHIIDHTRPLFSDDRCGLLEFAPEITVADVKAAANLAEAITAGFIREIEAASASGVAAEFLANLKDADGNDARQAKLKTFADACAARSDDDPKAFMTDIVKMAELMRQETETRLEIIEGFLAADVWPSIPSMQRNFSRWNATTCVLE